ncbi:DUF6894 family protein [Sphingomonas sp. Leaf343]|uniref:DUF6894 family protein n=1 Tax=Sphingomonas sp. Leaf343 TaxID=1736345 RepID=UPI00070022FB|nr:hypothetical protein [Sphingomonas sp. Leaf343]KQR83321.1 hypothetical protein ASG07_10305 [Sphingomonas sp. Leaf343]
MPHLFLNLENHNGLQPDTEGRDFDTVDAAIAEAGRTAGQVLAEDIAAGRTPVRIRVLIDDAAGQRQATLESFIEVKR